MVTFDFVADSLSEELAEEIGKIPVKYLIVLYKGVIYGSHPLLSQEIEEKLSKHNFVTVLEQFAEINGAFGTLVKIYLKGKLVIDKFFLWE